MFLLLFEIIFIIYIINFLRTNTKHSFFISHSFNLLSLLLSIMILGISVLAILYGKDQLNPRKMRISILIVNIIMSIFIPVILFFVIDFFLGIYRFIKRLITKSSEFNRVFMRRLKFTTYLLVFTIFIYGLVIGNKVNKVKQVSLVFANLPSEFDGFKIVQVSDIHLGSIYGNKKRINKLINKINSFSPDLFVFNGDMINYTANETDIYSESFKRIEAIHGKYAVLGNHDYGDYVQWDNYEDKIINIEKLKSFYKETGFKLLLNEAKTLYINNQSINILGVENWGKSPFPQYGDLKLASSNLSLKGFDLLISHDPSFWQMEVFDKYDVELTLSGHTHGFQLGFDFLGVQWSPSQYFYKEWNGLYNADGQYMYVNSGWGVIGYLGRIGFLPEITIIELKQLK